MKELNSQLLDARLQGVLIPGLQNIVQELKQFVVEARDYELLDINPKRIAQQHKLDSMATLKAFLYMTKAGIFDLSWSVHCPHCKGATTQVAGLDTLHQTGHCDMCQADFQAGFDQNVELNFQINPSVAKVAEVDPFQRALRYFELEPGITIALDPGESHFLQIDVKPGNYGVVKIGGTEVFNLPVGTKSASGALISAKTTDLIFKPGRPSVQIVPLTEGTQSLRIVNQGPEKAEFLFARLADPDWTDAALVSTLQEFRDLFSKEMISPDQSFSIRNLSLVFTDIKGSTEMYERLGDSKAFYLVKEHFNIMESVVREHNGGIVKTIGDAVMAVFYSPDQALKAARRMIEAFDVFNAQQHITNEIIVKIGIHLGPCIAVTLNERLDYFGTSVNIAARIQGLSDGRDIMVSERLYNEAGGKNLFADGGWVGERFVTSLKGLKATYPIWKLHRVS